jgi:proteasome assembly chaperone (PAC2) family protein
MVYSAQGIRIVQVEEDMARSRNESQEHESPIELLEKPEADEVYMLAGFHQWADGGSVSSTLPEYLVQMTHAKRIGHIRPEGFYLFQVPGAHDLMRPVVRFEDGFPTALDTQHNDFYYYKDGPRGVVIFLGDEPHMEVERYVASLLDAARMLNVRRIVGFGGVYGEFPYDRERTISCNYSLQRMKTELSHLGVTFSDYHGGASIDSIICKRAGEAGMEYTSLYAFVPAYDFSLALQAGNTIRIENDYCAWLGVMRRVNYMLKLAFDLRDLEAKSAHLISLVKSKLEELEQAAPQLGVREYLARLSEEYQEPRFDPLEDVWEDELKRLLGKLPDVDEGKEENDD